MANKVTVNEIEWPVEVIHSAKINGKIYDKVRCEWYSETKDIVVYDDEKRVEIVDRDPETLTIDELRKETLALRIKKRGKITYECPWCGKTFPIGRKDLGQRHMNGDRRRAVACNVRKDDANEDIRRPSTRPLIALPNN